MADASSHSGFEPGKSKLSEKFAKSSGLTGIELPEKFAKEEIPFLGPSQFIGFQLSITVLKLMGWVLLALFLFLLAFEIFNHYETSKYRSEILKYIQSQKDLSTGAAANLDEFIKQINKNESEHHDFIITLIERVLINVLLPVLTALLGYIFAKVGLPGSTEESS